MKPFSALRSLPGAVYLLSLGQGLGLTTAVISVNVAALAGAELSATPALSTVPYGLQFASAMVSGPVGSMMMGRIGRRPVFQMAGVCGAASGLVGWLAIEWASFALLCLTHALLGVFLAAVGLFRFAALDLTETAKHHSAMSLVLFGGVFAALLGPTLARSAPGWLDMTVFAASYLAIGAVATAVGLIVSAIRMPPPTVTTGTDGGKRSRLPGSRLLGLNPYTIAVACGAFGYGLMNLLMIAASLDMKARGMDFHTVSTAIQLHVFWMFFPSFFSGMLIGRMGHWNFLLLGTGLQIVCALVVFHGLDFAHYTVSLIILGLAWNALYVGGSQLVGRSVTGPDKFAAQGLNELIVAVISTIGALGAGSLLAALGWTGLNALAIGAAAMLAGAILAVARKERRRDRCGDDPL